MKSPSMRLLSICWILRCEMIPKLSGSDALFATIFIRPPVMKQIWQGASTARKTSIRLIWLSRWEIATSWMQWKSLKTVSINKPYPAASRNLTSGSFFVSVKLRLAELNNLRRSRNHRLSEDILNRVINPSNFIFESTHKMTNTTYCGVVFFHSGKSSLIQPPNMWWISDNFEHLGFYGIW